jgi:fermentation-respiration switch protein FrsA (DUF1100 family)
MRRLTYVLLIPFLVYTAALALAWLLQERLIYFPGPPPASDPGAVGLEFRDLTLETQDGERIHAWYVPGDDPARGAVLVCHGNAGNIAGRIVHAQAFRSMGLGVLLFDYRGYGNSTGVPNEEGTYADAEAAWSWLTTEGGVEPANVVLYGESLGCGVAIELARRRGARALISESGFTSLPDVAARAYPILPVRQLSRNLYANAEKLAELRVPVMVIHSPHDEIVPFEHGLALYSVARDPKEMLETGGGHNDGGFLQRQAWIARVASFLERY